MLLAVRFDEELSVAHRIDDGYLPCPQAVVVTLGDVGSSYRLVEPCGGEWGHDGECHRRTGDHTAETVCGLSLSLLPFVPAPAGLAPCPECFSEHRTDVHVEEGLFA